MYLKYGFTSSIPGVSVGLATEEEAIHNAEDLTDKESTEGIAAFLMQFERCAP